MYTCTRHASGRWINALPQQQLCTCGLILKVFNIPMAAACKVSDDGSSNPACSYSRCQELRQEQKVVFTLMDGRHGVFVSLPTDFGKSFCFNVFLSSMIICQDGKGHQLFWLYSRLLHAIMRDHI